jgi:LysM repeat protein
MNIYIPRSIPFIFKILLGILPFTLLEAQGLVAEIAKDSAKNAATVLDPKIDKLLHSDTSKFNYTGSNLLLINTSPNAAKNDDNAKLDNKKAQLLKLMNEKNSHKANIAEPNNNKAAISPSTAPISPSNAPKSAVITAKNIADPAKNAKGKHKTRIALLNTIDLMPSIVSTPIHINNAMLAAAPVRYSSLLNKKPAANVRNYEISPALDIIGKHKLVQRPVVQYESNNDPAAIYSARLRALPTIIPMTYNEIVHGFIDMYVTQKRDQVSRMLPRTDRYFTVFEEALDRHGLPLELKYLPVMESALIPHAKSQQGASGLWQLPYGIAKDYGLNCNDFIDERRDPKLSSEAAVMHLKNLYRKYLNWHLVIAAYHCGDGEMNKAIQKANGIRDYWELATFLPIETQAYVPLFIAAAYTMNYYYEHNIAKFDAPYTYYSTDTVRIKTAVSLRNIAKEIDMEINELQFLNPAIIHDHIPASTKGYPLNLPANKVGALSAYLNNLKNQKEIILNRTKEKDIDLPKDNMWQQQTDIWGNVIGTTSHNSYSQINNTVDVVNKPQSAAQDIPKDLIIAHYSIQKGDNMKRILQMFPGVTVRDIMRVNKMKDDKVKRGTTLKIPQAKKL